MPLLSKNETTRPISAMPALIALSFFALALAGAFITTCGANAAQARISGENRLAFEEMYSSASSLGLVLSDRLKSLDGQGVVMEGFMAPPLKPTLRFFVLTSVPMAICPFCSTDANWPNNIVLVYLKKEASALPFDRPIRVEGSLEIGSKTDEETGFVSLVRIYATRIEAVM